ncbi:hypothetical protein F511_35302 [Dorcoceras hygrometricum]|uniref:Uncharacterized protein n=1 Tax=Dorcoceras hygrometricum TaxID=472368 RepID=A0A2Z7BQG7_9LAMI|nr:hypothetical protein F511_35302 [Dorcoceras hygrometricum]
MAGAPTCSDQLSLVSQRFEPRLVSLEPPGPVGGPVGRALALVAGVGRTNEKTSRWSRRCSMAGSSTCSYQFSLVSPRFEPSLVTLEPYGPGVVHPEGLQQWWPEQGEPLHEVAAGRSCA